MANKQVKDYDSITTPALTDTLLCMQGTVTSKETIAQIFDTTDNLTSASTLAGAETIFCRVSGINSKATVDQIAEYILENS
jgi:hypothetical protein